MDLSEPMPTSRRARPLALRKYRRMVKDLRAKAVNATTLEELALVITPLAEQGEKIEVNGTAFGWCLLIGLAVLLLGYLGSGGPPEAAWLPNGMMWTGGGIIVCGWLLYYRAGQHGGLLDAAIADTYMRLCTGSHYLDLGSGQHEAADLGRSFVEFNRGNHKRYIEWMLEMPITIQGHRLCAHPYRFHYVDKETHYTTDSDGNSKTETKYHNYDRYGILIDLPSGPSISILSDRDLSSQGARYKPESSAFNQVFKVYHWGQAMDAARFLTPPVQLLLLRLASRFKNLNVERVSDRLCVSFDDDNLMDLPLTHNHMSPLALQAELRAGPRQPSRLTALLAELNDLVRYTQHDRDAEWPDLDDAWDDQVDGSG